MKGESNVKSNEGYPGRLSAPKVSRKVRAAMVARAAASVGEARRIVGVIECMCW